MLVITLLTAYTIILSLLVFQTHPYISAGFTIFHIIILRYFGLKMKKILKPITKAAPFLLLILVTSTLFTQDASHEGFELLSSPWTSVVLTAKGFEVGMRAVLGFVAIISISGFYQLSQAKQGLTALSQKYDFLTPFLMIHTHLSSDTRATDNKKMKGKKKKDKDMRKRSIWYLLHKIEDDLEHYAQMIRREDNTLSERTISITTVTFLLFSTKIIKILPGIPYASGQKLALVLPLLFYVNTKAKGLAATVTSFNFSLLSFVFGSVGQLGVVDIARLVLLGLCVDLLTPFLPKKGWLQLVAFVCVSALLGLLFGIFTGVLAYLFHVPDVIYLFLAPRIISNVVFGVVGGVLTFYLLDKTGGNEGQSGDKKYAKRR